jgi:hypothetical protein
MYTSRVHSKLHRGLLRPGKFAAVLSIVAFAIAGSAGTALAGGSQQGDCSWPAPVQPFAPWADANSYFLAPGGSFEGDVSGWSLNGGAAVVPGSESFFVGSATDSFSLSLPAGSSATSSSICVTADTPFIRLFASNNGSSGSTLEVDLNYTAKNGKLKTAQVALLSSGPSWAPSPQISFLDHIQPLLKKNGQTNISFTFTPSGPGWSIDDLYVDPLKNQNGSGRGGDW